MSDVGNYSDFLFANSRRDPYATVNVSAVDKKAQEAQQRLTQNGTSSQNQYKNTSGSMFGFGFNQ